jgi:hypothetical protein
MNWEIIGAIAEIAGVIAVVATLAFLLTEVRNSRKATEAASVDALSTGFNTLHSQIIADPEFAKIWVTGLANPDEVGDLEKMRLGLQLQSYLNHYGALRRHYESGLLPKADLEPYSIGMSAFMNSPGGRLLSSGFSIPPTIAEDMDEYKDLSVQYAWLAPAKSKKAQ